MPAIGSQDAHPMGWHGGFPTGRPWDLAFGSRHLAMTRSGPLARRHLRDGRASITRTLFLGSQASLSTVTDRPETRWVHRTLRREELPRGFVRHWRRR